jgi:hypothetical protein
MGLWIDQLFNSYIKHISEHTEVYIAWFIVTTVVRPLLLHLQKNNAEGSVS